MALLGAGHPARDDRAAGKPAALVVSAACRRFGVAEEDVLSASRPTPVSQARWAIAYVLIERMGWSLPRIGKLLQKDHTAVLYGYRRAKELYRTDQKFYEAVEELEKLL